MFSQIKFAHPWFFWLLLLLIPIIAWYIWKNKQQETKIQFSNLQAFQSYKKSYKVYLRHLVFVLRMVVLALIIVILARPQSTDKMKNISTEGIDIVMALDVSTSMLAQDLKPDRLKAAVKVAQDFVKKRVNDRIGLVVFAGESFTQCPITFDHDVLVNLLKEVKTGLIEDGTAIGMGLANAINRLKDSESKTKIIILLTDGENNKGSISPVTAAEIAANYNIRVYTIGVGTEGQAPYPFQTLLGTQTQMVDVKIDEKSLKEISAKTDGQYFRATDNQSLKEIYEKIEQLEKTKIEVNEYSQYNEEYLFWAILAGILLIIELFIRNVFLKSINN